ncbi:MAG TPA: hypothetical protein VGX76_07000 [Pirellulales bacterium]|jgi:hypothetical protein|nr:hypothetical protein [Pirellulales bacterium]
MGQIAFFRQARVDGGVRTGVEINGELVLHRFKAGSEEDDPSLLWFVDVCCENANVPNDAEGARGWLRSRTGEVSNSLLLLAKDLEAGVDTGPFPLQRNFGPSADGTATTIICSAVRRLDARHIANALEDVAQNWDQLLRELETEAQVAL